MREFCESCSGVVQKNKRKVALTCDKSLANPKPSGRRNEFLRALVGQFDDARADRVMQLYSEFATMAANAELPRWFYAAWASAGIMPLIKSELTQEQTEACR